MKLRVRVSGGSGWRRPSVLVLEVAAEATVAALAEVVAASAETDGSQLSLNGRDPLPSDRTLREVGVVSGDTVYLLCGVASPTVSAAAEAGDELAPSQAGGGPLPIRPPHPARGGDRGDDCSCVSQASFPRPRSPTVLPRATGAADLCWGGVTGNDSSRHGNETGDSNALGDETGDSSALGYKTFQHRRETGDSLLHGNQTGDPCTSQVSDSRCDVPEGSRSSDFEEAVKQADATPTCATPTDTLFLALHTLMLHSGYRPAQAVSAEAVSSVGGAYLTSYVTTVSTEVKVHLACVVMGKVMAVTATSSPPSCHSITCSTHIPLSRHLPPPPPHSPTPSHTTLRNTTQLSRTFKNSIANKMATEIRRALGLPEEGTLMSLLPELKLLLLKYLDVKSLVAMAAVCQEFHFLAEDPFVWQVHCFREFGKGHHKPSSVSWKQLYIAKFKQRRSRSQPLVEFLGGYGALDQRRRLPSSPLLPPLLGGDYDVFPNFHPVHPYHPLAPPPLPHPLAPPPLPLPHPLAPPPHPFLPSIGPRPPRVPHRDLSLSGPSPRSSHFGLRF